MPILRIDGGVPKILLLNEWQQKIKRRASISGIFWEITGQRRQLAKRVVEVVRGQCQLPHFVRAGRTPGRLAGGLHGRQEQRDEYANDGDDDQQLDKRKAAPARRALECAHTKSLSPRGCKQ